MLDSLHYKYRKATEKDEISGGSTDIIHKFSLVPMELEAYLDRYVVKQHEAKAVLATKICTHFNRIKYLRQRGETGPPTGYIKNNIMLIGPTGVGKTYLIKLIAKKIGVPFVKADATKFSETGYVGGDVEDLVRDLVREANGNIELAQYGIIFLDEIDKIASSPYTQGPDVSRSGVQRCLLKPLEETEVELKMTFEQLLNFDSLDSNEHKGKKTINTRNILFIASGAFAGLKEIILKRLSKKSIGFGANIEDRNDYNILKEVKPQDLISYGFESEFVGRFPVIVVLDELTEDDLYEILKNPNSPIIKAKRQDFLAYGINLKFDDEVLREIAKRAHEEGTGARALVNVLEKSLLKLEKILPSTTIKEVVVTKELLSSLQNNADINTITQIIKKDQPKFTKILINERNELLAQLDKTPLQNYDQDQFPLNSKRKELLVDLSLKNDTDLEHSYKELKNAYKHIKNMEITFYKRSNLRINLSEEAIDKLLEIFCINKQHLYKHCEKMFSLLEYGLPLIKEKAKNQHAFLIPLEAIENTEWYLNQLIKSCYSDD